MGNILSFGGWVLPHNPSTFTMSYENRIITHDYPDLNISETENLGLSSRVFSGEGAFYGPLAWSNFSQLSTMAYFNDVRILTHPNYGSFNARIRKLTSKEEPTPDFVAYDFEFIEHSDWNLITQIIAPTVSASTPSSAGANYYTVVKGDTLWGISKKYYGTGTKWPTIADANKSQIKNPNLIYPGQKFIIP
jgi:LysM repeat protein